MCTNNVYIVTLIRHTYMYAFNSVFSTLILTRTLFLYTVDDYRSQLSNALSGVDDILGSFDLPHDQMVPSYGVWYSSSCLCTHSYTVLYTGTLYILWTLKLMCSVR